MNAKETTVARLYKHCKEYLHLEQLNKEVPLDSTIGHADIALPGLLLAGFSGGVQSGRIQIIGEPEVMYLGERGEGDRADCVKRLFEWGTPCIVAAGGCEVPNCLLDIATSMGIPVLSTPLSPAEAIEYLMSFLSVEMAPETSVNGTLVDVHGTGILLRGKSGIGKSECALDLVQRGHRLVADDLVRVIAKPPGILIGRSTEALQNYVEVRGIGVVDIGSIYGIRALRRQKRIEVEVNLKEWDQAQPYDRCGLDQGRTEILGVAIPAITVPLVPGKSVSVIVEAVALSHILRLYGYDAPSAFEERWVERIKRLKGSSFEPRDFE